MRHLALATLPTVATTERGLTYTYRWPDLSIICSELPKNRMAAQLDGLVQYVRSVQGGKLDGRGERIVGRILKTQLVAGIEIPDTLQGLLLARIDRLPRETKRTLRVASVIGRQFGVTVLERLLETRQ